MELFLFVLVVFAIASFLGVLLYADYTEKDVVDVAIDLKNNITTKVADIANNTKKDE